MLPSPLAPWTGAPLRVMVVTEKPVEGTLSLIAPDGQRRGQIARPARRAALFLVRRGRSTRRRHLARDAGARPRVGGLQPVTRDIAVSARKPEPLPHPGGKHLAGAQ